MSLKAKDPGDDSIDVEVPSKDLKAEIKVKGDVVDEGLQDFEIKKSKS